MMAGSNFDGKHPSTTTPPSQAVSHLTKMTLWPSDIFSLRRAVENICFLRDLSYTLHSFFSI